MNATPTVEDRREIARADYSAAIDSGLALDRIAASHTSADRLSYHGMIPAPALGAAISALGRVASMGDFYADAATRALGRIDLGLTVPQNIAAIATALAGSARSDWNDTRSATGPEAGRPSQHVHTPTRAQRVTLLLAMYEVTFAIAKNASIGSVPTLGWAIREIVTAEGIQVWPSDLPLVAAELAR